MFRRALNYRRSLNSVALSLPSRSHSRRYYTSVALSLPSRSHSRRSLTPVALSLPSRSHYRRSLTSVALSLPSRSHSRRSLTSVALSLPSRSHSRRSLTPVALSVTIALSLPSPTPACCTPATPPLLHLCSYSPFPSPTDLPHCSPPSPSLPFPHILPPLAPPSLTPCPSLPISNSQPIPPCLPSFPHLSPSLPTSALLYRHPPALRSSSYAADFEKAGVEGVTLVGMTRGHPALANMQPAGRSPFECLNLRSPSAFRRACPLAPPQTCCLPTTSRFPATLGPPSFCPSLRVTAREGVGKRPAGGALRRHGGQRSISSGLGRRGRRGNRCSSRQSPRGNSVLCSQLAVHGGSTHDHFTVSCTPPSLRFPRGYPHITPRTYSP
ncbi:unnamed protein product [Closterium sp. Naga37s-1]|nr:unnamed protein product [Closterium sp. Naga37s-1]